MQLLTVMGNPDLTGEWLNGLYCSSWFLGYHRWREDLAPVADQGYSESCVQYRFGCQVCFLTAVPGSQGRNGLLCSYGRCCVSYFLLGLWGNASCAFYFCSQLNKDKLKSLNFWTLKKKKSKAFKDWLSFLFNLVLENVEWGGTYKISVCIK